MKKSKLYSGMVVFLCSAQVASAGTLTQAECELRRTFLKEMFDQSVPPVQLSDRDKQDQEMYMSISKKMADYLNDSWKKIQDRRLDQLLRSMRANSGLFSQDMDEDVFKKSIEGSLPKYSDIATYPASGQNVFRNKIEFELKADRNRLTRGKYSYVIEVCSTLDLGPSGSNSSTNTNKPASNQAQKDEGGSRADDMIRQYEERRGRRSESAKTDDSSHQSKVNRNEQVNVSFGKSCHSYNLDEVIQKGFVPFGALSIWEKSTTFPQNIRPGNIMDRDAQWNLFLKEQKYPAECFGFEKLSRAGEQSQERRSESVSDRDHSGKSNENRPGSSDVKQENGASSAR